MNYAFESIGISCGSSPSSFSMHIKEKLNTILQRVRMMSCGLRGFTIDERAQPRNKKDLRADSLRLQLEQSLLHRKSEPDSSWPKTNDAAIRLQRNKAVMSLQVTLARVELGQLQFGWVNPSSASGVTGSKGKTVKTREGDC
eukprot:XP_019077207.1 PREDICTED: uncharacterized protein LOC104880139 [Vitis vinifera]